MQSKREIYRFLTSEVKCYLDQYETMTIWDLRDLASGARRRIKSSDVKVISVPSFEGLTVDCMLAYASQFDDVMKALPIASEIRKLSRQYLENVIYTIIGDRFANWVDEVVEIRNKKVTSQKNMNIELDPEVAKIFEESTAVPSMC